MYGGQEDSLLVRGVSILDCHGDAVLVSRVSVHTMDASRRDIPISHISES